MKPKQEKATFFQDQPRWTMSSDRIIQGTTEETKDKEYKIRKFDNNAPPTAHAGNIQQIELRQYYDGTKSIRLTATSGNPWHKEKLIEKLEQNGFNANDPSVKLFPSEKHNLFEYKGDAQSFNLMLPNILKTIKELEGQNSIQSIEKDMSDFLQQEPAPSLGQG